MTCRYFLGETPTAPVTFDSLNRGLDDLDAQIGRIAKLEMLQPLERPLNSPVVFTACDSKYFFSMH